ncbi:MAG: hypothetical protein P4L96_13645 [Rhodoferax sp.]|nr:hypothetical protein [Rhodoferax sp.]
MNDDIPALKIERMDDGIGDGLILLEQDSGGNIDRVAIHPVHLRYLAEKMGLVETSDPQALKTIAKLQRRMLLLRDRIEHLSYWLHSLSDFKHADLSYEQAHVAGTEDMADEFCADFADKKVEAASTLSKPDAPASPQASLI